MLQCDNQYEEGKKPLLRTPQCRPGTIAELVVIIAYRGGSEDRLALCAECEQKVGRVNALGHKITYRRALTAKH